MSQRKLHLADNFALPPDAVTQTFAILAVRGAGKSNLAAVMAEEMFAAGLPFVVVDPVGAWWGLRARADGSPGLPVVIFGGRHGDVALERTAGQMIADLIVAERVSCVLDLSEFSEGDKTRFLIDFAERLYKKNEAPIHLFLEEADDFIPQRPFREQARLVRAWENVVRRGRGRGLGMTMITQRSAALNKNVLTQAETLFVLRTTSPQDRKAIEAWVEYQGDVKDILASLSSLKTGEALVWSPHWLKTCETIQVRRRSTFDSGATPKMAKGVRPAATLADVDLGAIEARMRETVERARAEDPRELRKRIVELERERAELQKDHDKTFQAILSAPVTGVIGPDLADELLARVREASDAALATRALVSQIEAMVETRLVPATREAGKRWVATEDPRLGAAHGRPAGTTPPVVAHVAAAPRGRPKMPPGPTGAPTRDLRGGERVILAAIVQQGGCSREQLSVLTGYKRSSRDTYLQKLLAAGLVLRTGGPGGETAIIPSDEGLRLLGDDFERLPTDPDDLRAWWMGKLSGGEAAILAAILDAPQYALSREDISALTDYKRSSRDTYIQRLKARRVIVDRDGLLEAAPAFWASSRRRA